MIQGTTLRLLLAAAVSLGLALLLLITLYVTDIGFRVWAHLREAPPWFSLAYLLGLLMLATLGGWLLWRILFPRKKDKHHARPDFVEPEVPDEAELTARLERAETQGVDAAAARRELMELGSRRETGEVHVALFGQVSMGKSSVVRALLPDAHPEVDPRGGTTRHLERHVWRSPAGDRLVLVDMPGLNEADGELEALSRDEAQRAHIVVYLVDGDLTRDQYQDIERIISLGKPVIVAVNKADLWGDQDRERIRERIRARLGQARDLEVVTVSAGALREVTLVHSDGREEMVTRRSPPRVAELVRALQRRIDQDTGAIERLRDAAVFVLASDKLDSALAEHRRVQADAVVSDYTRKAVIGALAAVTPGTDVLIQGYLGVRMVKALCDLYEVPVHKVDIERLLGMASGRLGKLLPLTLAIAGNALKAFPGVGTLTGGLAHAVAYGLLFDGLGRAVARTLASRGELPPGIALRNFEETLGENLETRARRLAKLALSQDRPDRAGTGDAPRDTA